MSAEMPPRNIFITSPTPEGQAGAWVAPGWIMEVFWALATFKGAPKQTAVAVMAASAVRNAGFFIFQFLLSG
jgi:hypothetical protein